MSLAIITGASSGIGKEFARQLCAAGYDTFWFIARRKEPMEALAKELGVKAKILCADLSDEEGIGTVVQALAEERPVVDMFISAAGFGRFGTFDQIPPEVTADMIDLNVKASVLLTHAVIPYMPRGGRIIEMGSASCFTPLPGFNVYAASKAFILHYTKALRAELRPWGIRVTCFCPGWVDTAFLGSAEATPGVALPKAYRPLLRTEDVVRRALRASARGALLCVTNWFTKLQHLLFKLLPDRLLTAAWLRMLRTPDSPPADGAVTESSAAPAPSQPAAQEAPTQESNA